ncbi:hypothetical protein [Microbacterium sp. BH-3-3-3]|uniref:hypothetical protein n=1 Tax=Microbacterium sp. BH-3-3-3 TaxID=1906742 RepID=UPI0011A97B00|nr:hypothetical protein [Microbacterium sp. BH-3-3-3]
MEYTKDFREHLVVDGFTSTLKERQRLYVYAAVLAFMLRSHRSGTNWHMTFKTQAKKLDLDLIDSLGSSVVSRERNMGFPEGWASLAIWSTG